MIELLNGISGGWAEYFGLAVIQNTVFLALVFVLLYFLRRAPARVRYVVGCVGLIKLLLPPFMPSRLFLSAAEPLGAIGGGAFSLTFTGAAGGPGAVAAPAGPSLSTAAMLYLVWGSFAAGYILYSVIKTFRLLSLLEDSEQVRGCRPSEFALSRGVAVRRSARISIPLTVGILPRRIYVPASWDQWSEESRMAAVKHEMAHIERWDGFFQALQIVVQAIYFFHPLVLLLGRRLGELREMACDDASISPDGRSHIEYSRCLVEIAEKMEFGPFACESASTLIRRKRELLSRVKYQLKGGSMRTISRKRAAVALAILVLLIVPLSWYRGGVTAKQPAASPAVAPVPIPGKDLKSVTLALHGVKMIKVGDSEVPLKELVALLDEQLTGDRSKLVVKLECDKTVPMQTIYDVQELLTSMDLRKVEFRGQGYKDMALVLPPANVDEWLGTVSEENILRLVVDKEGHAVLDNEKVPHAKLREAIQESSSRSRAAVIRGTAIFSKRSRSSRRRAPRGSSSDRPAHNSLRSDSVEPRYIPASQRPGFSVAHITAVQRGAMTAPIAVLSPAADDPSAARSHDGADRSPVAGCRRSQCSAEP
jgi:beta-lactamase regulating signal transducer with metallopeptidase domain